MDKMPKTPERQRQLRLEYYERQKAAQSGYKQTTLGACVDASEKADILTALQSARITPLVAMRAVAQMLSAGTIAPDDIRQAAQAWKDRRHPPKG